LTNKDGSVKLADFGVATMMPGLVGDANAGGGDDSVVGSPYWSKFTGDLLGVMGFEGNR
jgi:hypothetical protein